MGEVKITKCFPNFIKKWKEQLFLVDETLFAPMTDVSTTSMMIKDKKLDPTVQDIVDNLDHIMDGTNVEEITLALVGMSLKCRDNNKMWMCFLMNPSMAFCFSCVYFSLLALLYEHLP